MPQYTDKLSMQNLDPRVVRTRRLLIDSINTLRKQNKSLRSLSVRDITEKAGVNRVTFYAHFTDKYELIDVWKRDMFRRAYKNTLQANPKHEVSSIEILITVVLEFLSAYNESKRPTNKQFEPLLEAAIQQEIKTIILQILESNPIYEQAGPYDPTVTFLSWAIFGSANDWSHGSHNIDKEEVVGQLMVLVQNTLHLSV